MAPIAPGAQGGSALCLVRSMLVEVGNGTYSTTVLKSFCFVIILNHNPDVQLNDKIYWLLGTFKPCNYGISGH